MRERASEDSADAPGVGLEMNLGLKASVNSDHGLLPKQKGLSQLSVEDKVTYAHQFDDLFVMLRFLYFKFDHY